LFKKTGVILLSSALLLTGGSLAFGPEQGKAKKTPPPQANQKVENVIFMVPDGYSASYATNYRWYKGEETVLDSMLVGMMRTHSANSEVTDSAAAGTAMATGEKTNNGMISMSPEGEELDTILEAAEERKLSTGLVATSTITHATPAVFASHVDDRNNEAAIAPQILENDVDVILGGGKEIFLPESKDGKQEKNLIQQAKDDGYIFVEDSKALSNVKKEEDKLLGLFAEGPMAPELDREETKQPSLSEMTDAAINVLKKDKDGFFLMVEGSQIDWAGHAHDAAWAMADSEAFEEAVQAAVEFAKKDKNTLVVVAADHDTGGMSVGGYGEYDANLEILRDVTATGDFMAEALNEEQSNAKEVVKKYAEIDLTEEEISQIRNAEEPANAINEVISKRALVGWTSTEHTGTDVPLYAFGPQADLFAGLHNNTDLPHLFAEALKIKFE